MRHPEHTSSGAAEPGRRDSGAITVGGLGKSFGSSAAVSDLSLDIPSGAFVVLLGPSGCGKTTTLRMIAGLEDATSGIVRFGERTIIDAERGTSVPAEKRGIGMVFQSYALWPHMSVRQNIEWPLSVAKWSRSDRMKRVEAVLESLEIAHLAGRTPAEISGGQQQRVAIARTIAPRPDVILFDEPLSNLDARLRVETRAELGRVHRETGATSLYVTHDQIEALALATHIAVMKDGRLEQFGTPSELLETPRTAFVARFLGSPAAVLLPVGVAGVGAVDAASAMYRPDALQLDPAGELTMEVLESTPAAGRHLVSGLVHRPGSGEAATRVTVVSDTSATPGDATGLRLPDDPAALFDENGVRL